MDLITIIQMAIALAIAFALHYSSDNIASYLVRRMYKRACDKGLLDEMTGFSTDGKMKAISIAEKINKGCSISVAGGSSQPQEYLFCTKHHFALNKGICPTHQKKE